MAQMEIKAELNDELFTKLRNDLPDDVRVKLAIHNTLAKRCDPYVPFLNGPLSQTVRVNEEGVTYNTIYARYQYYGVGFRHTLEYHPLASAKWDEAMMRDHKEEFCAEVKEIIKGDWLRRNGR